MKRVRVDAKIPSGAAIIGDRGQRQGTRENVEYQVEKRPKYLVEQQFMEVEDGDRGPGIQ